MSVLGLALRSLWHRRLIMGLSLLSISLSVALLVGVERVRDGVRSSFSGSISKTDLIVGAPGGNVELLLFSVFNIGSGIGGIGYETYERIRAHGDVAWAVPFSLGDSFRGRRVFGTTREYFEHFRHHGDNALTFQAGGVFESPLDVVLGAEVAKAFGLKMGDQISLEHGVGDSSGFSGLKHDNARFEVVGVLNVTATPVDQSVYVSLAAIEAIHAGWEDGAPPPADEALDASEVLQYALDHGEPEVISGVFVGAHSRLKVLSLQRELVQDADEPLLAILPGVALAELWKNFGFFEQALRLISILVMAVGLSSVFGALYASLAVRRREMAILRSLGAGFSQIASLFVLEALFVSLVATALGMGLVYFALLVGAPLLLRETGVMVALTAPGSTEALALGLLLVLGTVVGFIPAVKAYRTALSDGLSVRL